jgi:pyruvate dehydrogenase E1 component beta subunit
MRAAVFEEMRRDDRIIVMGEDVRRGVVGYTAGLADEFGPERVLDTPISESTFVGAGLGAAATGLVPIVDMLMSTFLYVAMDQILNQAAKLRYMMGGACDFPLTIIGATGGGAGMAAQHSESPHPIIMNSGGVKIVLPSTPADAKGLLKAAIRDPNPVVVLYHGALGAVRGEVPDDEEFVVPLGEGCVLREGSDLTIAGIGVMAKRALSAADRLATDGISAEVTDPRTLHPLGWRVIAESVRKTGLLLAVDEARRTCSAASEIVARVSEDSFDALRGPPTVIAVEDVPIPFTPPLEGHVIPGVERIYDAARDLAASRRVP